MEKEEVKLSLFTDNMIVHLENPIVSTKKLLDLISEFYKTVGYQANIQKSKALLYTNTKYQKQKSGKTPISYVKKTNKIPWNEPNEGGKRPALKK